jgi:UDPglucose 6-dehydrogenase
MTTPANSQGAAAHPRRIGVIGGGYVGTPTAVMLAHFGHLVTLAERDDHRRELLAQGRSPMVEEGLETLLGAVLASGRLSVVASAAHAARDAEVLFVCVATPGDDAGRADLAQFDAAVDEVAGVLAPWAVVVNKSTVPVGTAERVRDRLGRTDVAVVSNPEFLREGAAIRNSFAPDRTVIGAEDDRAAALVAELFAPTGAPVVRCDVRTAELIKYAANAYLSTRLSFVNELTELCDALNADVAALLEGLVHDPRIGVQGVSPGPGWGGPCLPKDAEALVTLAADADVSLRVLSAAVAANDAHAHYVADAVGSLTSQGGTVALLGLTFKANTGDLRDSPALRVAATLLSRGLRVRAYDPVADHDDVALAALTICDSPAAAASDADVVAVLTEWPQFASLDWSALSSVVRRRQIYDARDVVDAAAAREAGFSVTRLGRPSWL